VCAAAPKPPVFPPRCELESEVYPAAYPKEAQMSRNPNSRGRARPYINLTPLIDVLLVLLIIFMVISPARPSRFEARIPEKLPPDQPRDACDLCLVVSVPPSGGVYHLNRQSARTLEELGTQLYQALNGRPSDRKTVFIKAPRLLPYGEVVKVIDVVKAAGSSPIGLQIEDLDP
jgi:biopolymer transport protein ExbD